MKAEWTNRDSLSIETTSQNSKAVLVMKMPENCAECKLMYLQGIGESICNAVDWEERPSWCPLKPMPQKKEDTYAYWIARGCNDAESYINGWNDCIDEITGETE